MEKLNSQIFQDLIIILQRYWAKNGCIILQSFDMEIGAGTLHPMTYFGSLGSKPISIAYIQPSRRPSDGRYGKSQNRLQYYYQFQVILKPTPENIQELYLMSLKEIGINLKHNDLQFVEDNWENPTLGAFGLGWEIRLNGIEITQFTYFQKIGGLDCFPIAGEITYGLERLSMHLQKIDNVFEIVWSLDKKNNPVYYKDILYRNEVENSIYNFKYSNVNFLLSSFEEYEKKANELISLKNPLLYPAYELTLKAIHTFNLLETRKILSVIERKNYILRIYSLSKRIAQLYLK